MNHYRCHEVDKSDTKTKMISDTVEFRHDYLKVPSVANNNRIVNGLKVMASVISNALPPTSTSQLEAIDSLKKLLDKWRRSALT